MVIEVPKRAWRSGAVCQRMLRCANENQWVLKQRQSLCRAVRHCTSCDGQIDVSIQKGSDHIPTVSGHDLNVDCRVIRSKIRQKVWEPMVGAVIFNGTAHNVVYASIHPAHLVFD